MADESTTAAPELKVIQGEGLGKPPTPVMTFDPTTRTSVQKRIAPLIGELKTVVKAAIASEFAEVGGPLKKGNDSHERRFARALFVEVGRLMFDAGIKLHNIGNGSFGTGGSLRQDLIESGVIKVEAPAEGEEEDEGEDEDGDEDGDES